MRTNTQDNANAVPPARLQGGRRLDQSARGDVTPLLTIITVVYNGGDALVPTIDSVLALRRQDIEYIIIDGGSKDHTVDILRRFDEHLDYWLSERDAGIYDAMNKAIELARGEFVYHLNIGDQVLAIPALLDPKLPADVVCLTGRVETGVGQVHVPSADWRLKLHNTLHHQGCFYRRVPQLHYDLSYRVFSDFDLNQRLAKTGLRVLTCTDIVAVHDQGGVSHNTNRFDEVFHIIRKNEGLLWMCGSVLYFKLRGLRNRLRKS